MTRTERRICDFTAHCSTAETQRSRAATKTKTKATTEDTKGPRRKAKSSLTLAWRSNNHKNQNLNHRGHGGTRRKPKSKTAGSNDLENLRSARRISWIVIRRCEEKAGRAMEIVEENRITVHRSTEMRGGLQGSKNGVPGCERPQPGTPH